MPIRDRIIEDRPQFSQFFRIQFGAKQGSIGRTVVCPLLPPSVCIGEYVGLGEIDDGIWNVYFGPLKLGRLNERHMRIEDQYGRLKRRKV